MYGHTYYAPGLANWSSFGAPAQSSGFCCGPLKPTMGGQPGRVAGQCGTYMYSEIVASQPANAAFDNETQSDVAYFPAPGGDGYTPAGTWLTYTSPRSAAAIARFAAAHGLGSVFTFDSSMDTMDGGKFTYTLMNTIADALEPAP